MPHLRSFVIGCEEQEVDDDEDDHVGVDED